MTGRQRLSAILRHRRPDRLSWTILADGATLGALDGGLRGLSQIDFARHLGADVLLLDGWGTGAGFASPAFSWGPGVSQQHAQDGRRAVIRHKTRRGELTASFENGHPTKHPVTTLDDARVYRAMWEQASYEPRDDTAVMAGLANLLGDDGVTTRFWGPTAIPHLLEYAMGMEGFYYLLADHPDELTALIDVIHARHLDAFAALAAGPCETVTLVENTSTRYISPDIYERFNGPHVKAFVDIMHRAGKTAIIHMCGHVLKLLPLIRRTGADGVHALTPPPVGDTPWEAALDELGEDTVIVGAFNPDVFVSRPVEEIPRALDALYTPRLRETPVCLCAFADGLCVPLERWEAVADWFRRNG